METKPPEDHTTEERKLTLIIKASGHKAMPVIFFLALLPNIDDF